MEKRERGSNIVIPLILRLLGRISSGKKGEGDGNFREENQDFRKFGWGRISRCMELYTPLEKVEGGSDVEDGEVEEVDSDAEDEIDREDENKDRLQKLRNLRYGDFVFAKDL